MACVTNYCNDCTHTWVGIKWNYCPKCECPDFIREFDEWQDHEGEE